MLWLSCVPWGNAIVLYLFHLNHLHLIIYRILDLIYGMLEHLKRRWCCSIFFSHFFCVWNARVNIFAFIQPLKKIRKVDDKCRNEEHTNNLHNLMWLGRNIISVFFLCAVGFLRKNLLKLQLAASNFSQLLNFSYGFQLANFFKFLAMYNKIFKAN